MKIKLVLIAPIEGFDGLSKEDTFYKAKSQFIKTLKFGQGKDENVTWAILNNDDSVYVDSTEYTLKVS